MIGLPRKGFNPDSGFFSGGSLVPVLPPDTVPDVLNFVDATNVEPSTPTQSNIVTVTGIDAPSPVSIMGGGAEHRIDDGLWVSTPGTVTVNQTIQLRVTSSALFETAVNVTLNIGGELSMWTVTTRADQTLADQIQAIVDTMPAGLEGLWFYGYNVQVNDGDPNNQRVRDWSSNNHHLFRGDSTFPNTSSPTDTSHDGDDYSQMQNSANITRGSLANVTYCAKINIASVTGSDYIIDHGANRPIIYANGSTIQGLINSGGAFVLSTSGPYIGLDTHVTLVGQAAQRRAILYINGVSEDVGTDNQYHTGLSASDTFIVGSRDGTSSFFDGDIYYVYYYNRVLGVTEINDARNKADQIQALIEGA